MPESKFVCPVCKKELPNRGGLNLHMHKAHGQPPPSKKRQQQKNDDCSHEYRLLDPNNALERKILRQTDYTKVCTKCQEVV